MKNIKNWSELSRLSGGETLVVEKVRLKDSGIKIEGDFELPPLVALPSEDQVFVSAFVRTHGSIKEMERLFGVSYPTIKNRLNQISERLGFLNVEVATEISEPAQDKAGILEKLEKGELTAKEAIKLLKK